MRYVAIARDFIRSVYDDDALVEFSGNNARALAKQCRLADSRASQKQQALSGFDHVTQNVNGSEDGPADATCQADDDVAAIPKCGDPVKSSLDARSVIESKGTDSMGHVIEVLASDVRLTKIDGSRWKTGFGLASQIHNHFDKIFEIALTMEGLTNVGRHDAQ